MEDFITRFIADIFGRTGGALKFRFILQPLMAIIFAVIDGVRDAKAGKPAYLWGLFRNPENRKERLKSGWKSVGKIFILAVILDIVYGLIEHEQFYPGETLFVAVCLAIVPYLLLRGPVNLLTRFIMSRSKKDPNVTAVKK
jgi:hypothetical protein